MSNEQGIYIYDDGWKTVSKEEKLQTVNKKQPDTEGNVQLSKSDIGLSNVDNTKQATKAEFDTHVKDTVKHVTAQERTDWNAKETTTGSQAKATKALTDSKAYTDTKISEIPEVDTSHLETKSDAQAKLTEAKGYTNTKTTNMETTTGAQAKADKALTDSKSYTDTEIAKIPKPDVSSLETKEDAQAKLTEAKGYTDTKISQIPEVDTSSFVSNENIEQIEVTTGESGTAFGYKTSAEFTGAFAAGDRSIARGDSAIALGNSNESRSDYSFSAGYYSKATGSYSIALGRDVTSDGSSSVAIGHTSKALAESAVSIGAATASGKSSVSIGGTFSKANASSSIALGGTTEGIYSVAIGKGTKSNTLYSTSIGNSTISSLNSSLALGKFNVDNVDTDKMLVFGLGSSIKNRLNGMVITESGDMHLLGQYKTGGADYAEMFEWEDKNPENIDRVALAVTWGEGESIKLASSGDEIIGIVSATAAVLGDNPEDWDRRFVTDQFGRKLMKEYTEINEEGEEETFEWFIENPEYDKDTPYISRSDRKEWDAIGLVGKLYWIDDGTLEVGDYATVGENGIATKGTKENGYRVMKRISKNVDGNSGVVKVFFK